MAALVVTEAPTPRVQADDIRVPLLACKRILTKLKLLSDAPTSQMRVDGIAAGSTGAVGLRTRDTHGMGVKGGRYTASQIPAGVEDGTGMLGNGHAPSKRLSLYAHYLWRMTRAQRADDAEQLSRLASMAQRDYDEYVGIRHPRQHGNDEAAVTELLRDWTGCDAVDVALWLHVSPRWVKRQRVLNGRDPNHGEPREFDERTKRIIIRAQEGATQEDIAREVGVSQSRISRILRGE